MVNLFVTLFCLCLLFAGAEPHDARALALRGGVLRLWQARAMGRRWALRVEFARVV